MRWSKKKHRLEVKWHPNERDVHANLSPRIMNADLGWALSEMFSKDKMLELERRGYDLASMRFRIDKTPEAILAHERRMGR
jgi:hypothetical protein